MKDLEPLTPVYTAALFPDLCAELITLLRSLEPGDWDRRTIAGAWRVRDVAAHLLDVDLRKLAGGRDRHPVTPRRPSSFAEVVDVINDLNAGGVRYGERLSPRLVTDLLEVTGTWVSAYVAALPSHGEATLPVAWAGEERSEHWMDIDREYTERWHHQMQIRDAVGSPRLTEHRWFYPVLDLSVRAFHRTYRTVAGTPGAAVVFEVGTENHSVWSVVRDQSAWRVMRGQPADAAARVSTDPETAWKLFFNALSPAAARERVVIHGDRALAEPMLGTRAVMV